MIDKIDDQIIRILAKNGRITLSDLAKEVNLSISPCQARLKKLGKKIYTRIPCKDKLRATPKSSCSFCSGSFI